MDKTKLKNKAIQDILEDAQDGVLKDDNIAKVKEIVKESKGNRFEYAGKCYDTLREIPVPFTQAQAWLESGKIKKCK